MISTTRRKIYVAEKREKRLLVTTIMNTAEELPKIAEDWLDRSEALHFQARIQTLNDCRQRLRTS